MTLNDLIKQENLASKVTEIIFNRTAGWSSILEEVIKESITRTVKAVLEEVKLEKKIPYLRKISPFSPKHKAYVDGEKANTQIYNRAVADQSEKINQIL